MERIANDIIDKRFSFLTMDDLKEKRAGNLLRFPKSFTSLFTFPGKPYRDCPSSLNSFDKPVMMSTFLNKARYPEQHKILRHNESISIPEKYGEDF